MSNIRSAALTLRRTINRITGTGALPEFLIIGAQKAGTTSLFNYIMQSKQAWRPLRKEVHHFDEIKLRSLDAYRAFFPDQRKLLNAGALTGEATPFYLFHPDAARRIAASNINPKLIVILRCPVERAWSHYRHELRKGREVLGFIEALNIEDSRLRGTADRVLDERHLEELRRHSYVARGQYMRQIRRYAALFDADRMLVISLDAMRENPSATVSRCCDFLGIKPPPANMYFNILNSAGPEKKMPEVDKDIFREAFDEDLRSLETMLPEAAIWRARLR